MEISHKMVIIFLFFTVLLIPHIGKAYVKSHPLREITPINTSLNMSKNTRGISYNMTNIGWINPSSSLSIGSQLNLKDNLSMGGNSINSVSNLVLGWENLTSYPTGCNADEAVQVIDNNLECVQLDPGGVVNTTGGNENELAFFINNTTVSSDSNLYWDDSLNRLGIGTSSPGQELTVVGAGNITSTLDLGGNLDLNGNNITNIDKISADDWSDANYNIKLKEQNITNENWVDESGDVMSGQLNITDDIDLKGNSIKSSNGEICIGNQCN